MKLFSYLEAGSVRLGALDGEVAIDLARAAEAAGTRVPADIIDFLAAGDSALEAAKLAVERGRESADLQVRTADTTALPPVPRPPKIICVARNYAEHAKEAGLAISEIPIVFARFANTLVADGMPVVRPSVSEQFDWEGELAIVIGKPGRHIKRDQAMDHIAGYSIFNDVSVRDYQFRVTQYTSGKNFAASGPFGPYLVTADEVADPHALSIRTEVNGVVKQTGNTADLIYDLPTIIEHISEWIDLEVGDVIPTGTPAGVGFKRTPPEFLEPGDTVTVTIDGLGTLTNPVVAEEELSR